MLHLYVFRDWSIFIGERDPVYYKFRLKKMLRPLRREVQKKVLTLFTKVDNIKNYLGKNLLDIPDNINDPSLS